MLDYNSIVIYLHMQGKTGKVIQEEMCRTLGDNAIAYSTVNKYIRHYVSGHSPKQYERESIFDTKIIQSKIIEEALEKERFASVRELAHYTKIPKTSVWEILVNSLHYENRHLRWVPHNLTADHKRLRVQLSRQLLRTIRSARKRGWEIFVTGDESYFYYSYNYEMQWVKPGEFPATREKRLISSKKIMVTVFWNPNGIQRITCLPPGTSFTSDYMITEVLGPLQETMMPVPRDDGRKLVIHMDNAGVHTSKQVTTFMEANQMKKAVHPPYSPDLAPSDFFLFGYIKRELQGSSFKDTNELFSAIIQNFSEISSETLLNVMAEWEERLTWVIEHEGDYFP